MNDYLIAFVYLALDSGEQKCVAMCMDRYMDAWNVVSKAYATRLAKERSRGGGLS